MFEVTKKHCFKSGRYESARIRINNYDFVMPAAPSYVTDLEDFTILSDFDITPYVVQSTTTTTTTRNRGFGVVQSPKSAFEKPSTDKVSPMFPDLKTPKGGIVASQPLINKTEIEKSAAVIHGMKCIPRTIRDKLEPHWIHSAHIQTFSRALITRDRLRSRVIGGQILAYHYKECDIAGNRCVYYGFLPTTRLRLKSRVVHADGVDDVDNAGGCDEKVTGNDGRITNTDNVEPRFANNAQDFDIGGHSLCRLNTQRIWPRYVYLRLTKECACSCSKQCVRVSVLTRDDVSGMSKLEKFLQPKNTYCIRQVPWENVYLMMGSNNDSVVESLVREHRSCKTCAQCRKCSNSPVFCRDHKVCRHKKSEVPAGSVNVSSNYIPKIQRCKRVYQ